MKGRLPKLAELEAEAVGCKPQWLETRSHVPCDRTGLPLQRMLENHFGLDILFILCPCTIFTISNGFLPWP